MNVDIPFNFVSFKSLFLSYCSELWYTSYIYAFGKYLQFIKFKNKGLVKRIYI